MLTFNTQTKSTQKLAKPLLMAGLLTLGLTACNDNDNDMPPPVEPPMEYSYSLTLTNLTYACLLYTSPSPRD